jgi:hypothetical protein
LNQASRGNGPEGDYFKCYSTPSSGLRRAPPEGQALSFVVTDPPGAQSDCIKAPRELVQRAQNGAYGRSAQVVKHSLRETRQDLAEPDENILHLQLAPARDLTEAPQHLRRLHLIQDEEILLRMAGGDVPRTERVGGEMLEVECEDERTLPPNRRGEYVTILRVVSQSGNEALVIRDDGVGERSVK